MAIRTELSLRVPNNPGALARVCEVLNDARINILALDLASPGMMRLLVDNHVHAAALLREQHYQVDERDVIYTVTSNGPGALARIARLLAEAGVNVEYMYATAIEGSPMAAIVAGVPGAERAAAAAGL
jgi:hypothetical protein